jgi:hypothetical protein
LGDLSKGLIIEKSKKIQFLDEKNIVLIIFLNNWNIKQHNILGWFWTGVKKIEVEYSLLATKLYLWVDGLVDGWMVGSKI